MSDPVVTGLREDLREGRREGERPRPLLRTMIGEALRRNRLSQRRTLADVARVARISMAYLSELERGRKEASSEVLAAICDALRIELYDVLAEVGRGLAADRARRASVVRLEAIRRRDASVARSLGSDTAGGSGQGKVVCLLAA